MLKKIGLAVILLFFTMAGYAVVSPSTSISTTSNNNITALENLLSLSPKNFEKATGHHLSFKEKIAYRLLQWKLRYELRHPQKKDVDIAKAERNSKSALFCGLITWGALLLGLFLPFIGILSLPFSIAAIIYGGISLNKTPNNTNSIIGIVLGSVFLLLFAVVLLLVFSLLNY